MFLDYSDEEYDRIVDLNLRGVFYFLRAFGRIMRDQGGGSLIATSSMRATTLEPGLAIYGATKAGIIQLVRGLASELGPRGVRVNAIVPQHCRDAAGGAAQGTARDFQQTRRPHRVQPLEPAQRGGDRCRLPRLGRGELHYRQRLDGGRRLDGDRWTAVRLDRKPYVRPRDNDPKLSRQNDPTTRKELGLFTPRSFRGLFADHRDKSMNGRLRGGPKRI
jgi:hypothetical protein